MSTCGPSQLVVKVLVQCDNVCVLLYVVWFMNKILCRVIFVVLYSSRSSAKLYSYSDWRRANISVDLAG